MHRAHQSLSAGPRTILDRSVGIAQARVIFLSDVINSGDSDYGLLRPATFILMRD